MKTWTKGILGGIGFVLFAAVALEAQSEPECLDCQSEYWYDGDWNTKHRFNESSGGPRQCDGVETELEPEGMAVSGPAVVRSGCSS